MRTEKTFDCVQMKWDIQRKLREEEKGLSLDERHALMQRKILSDTILGPWLQRITQRQSTQTADVRVAEAGGVYGSQTK
ncbi:MAG: hypothetical protein WC381_00845 [Kiritimatiellia bacterium]|jgi:hypothetical protein